MKDSMLSIFKEYCRLPHPSYHTEAATDFCMSFAASHGLVGRRDEAGNVVICKPATPGKEDHPTVILQGHLDMVAEKEPTCPLDLTRDGLELFEEGDLIGARGTTLGGDNGIAVAMMLSILADKERSHPALEAVFTTDEEVGMLGAQAMDMRPLRGRYLINLDSEEEGVLTVSCAGGATATLTRPAKSEPHTANILTLTICGLQGGHSGAEIHRGRANAAKLCAAAAAVMGRAGGNGRLISLHSGEKDNAIPAHAVCCMAVTDASAAHAAVEAFMQEAKTQFAEAEPHFSYTVTAEQATKEALSPTETDSMLSLLAAIPVGPQKMSEDIPGLVQTSLNLGILDIGAAGLRAVYSVRSSVSREKEDLLDQIAAAAARADATCTVSGAYPPWEYRKDCPLRETVLSTYRRLYGKEMRVEAIHAGLECGLFASRIPGLYCVSLGPNMQDIHTPRERLSLSSSQRTYEFVCEILSAL